MEAAADHTAVDCMGAVGDHTAADCTGAAGDHTAADRMEAGHTSVDSVDRQDTLEMDHIYL